MLLTKIPLASHHPWLSILPISTATTCTFNEHETNDYDTLTREIKKMCDSAYNDYQQLLVANTHFGLSVSQGEAELLRSIQNQGGIALKLSLEDTDGENNTYHEQHIANPKGAKTLKNYLDNTAEALGNYMINKIRDKDGENEGAINIKSMTLTFFFPRFVETKLDLAERYIHAVNIRAKTPPFLYLDPASSEANTIIQKAFSDITYELKVANGDVSQSKKFLQAVNRLLEKEGVSLKEMSETQRKTKISAVSDELLQVYYRISAKNIEKHQRLLIAQQPYQTEFIGRALCRQLDIDEFHWPIITAKPLRISYETGLENVGSFIRGDRLTSKTLLEIVYDQPLRKEVGLATNKNDVLTALASTLKQACQLPVDELALKEKIAELFDATYLVIATSANNGNLSDELNHPQETFIRNNDKYIEQAAKDYRRLEAEKIALSSNDILSLMNQVIRLREAGQPIDFETLLNNNQKILLNPRTEKFKDFLKVQRNSDDFSDLVPAWQQIALQLKDFALQVCRNAPLEICMAVNLVDDIVEGADAETLGMDGLFYAASVLSRFKNLSLQRLGALAQQGGNAWSLVQSIEAYKQAIKDKNYQAANQCLVGIFMSAHGLLASGAAIVESLHEHVTERMSRALTDEKMEENKPINANEDHVAERDDGLVEKPATTAHEMNGHDQYWTFNEQGQLFEKTIGRAVVSSLWNGDVIVKGGARAIALGDGTETVYMLGNTAHQAARTPEGNLELWPIHDMNLREGRWSKVFAANPEEVSFVRSSEASAAFPDNFSGLSTRSETSSLNTVTWYDNHMSTFDTITAEKKDAGGISSGTESIHIGVIEHKYVIEHHGSIEILDHHGTTNGKTTLIRNDGSSFTIDRELLKKPTYKPKIQAKIVGAKGMFVTVEISEAVNGLVNKKTVGGVLATTKTGGQELVVQLDEGVHYRGTVAKAERLALTPGETSVDQEPIHLDMQKISSEADPKRASPELWRIHPAYKESIAHDDFALELFYGAKAANEAYTKNLKWLQENTRVIGMIKDELPPEMRDVFNPYYLLSTSEENAILFAARNRVKLASTLLGKTTTRWGGDYHTHPILPLSSRC
ncbi:hypothetical protein [Candidatus Regiella insecticola]|nr:hypothetical protein [Candidatus Regiella insecticola]